MYICDLIEMKYTHIRAVSFWMYTPAVPCHLEKVFFDKSTLVCETAVWVLPFTHSTVCNAEIFDSERDQDEVKMVNRFLTYIESWLEMIKHFNLAVLSIVSQGNHPTLSHSASLNIYAETHSTFHTNSHTHTFTANLNCIQNESINEAPNTTTTTIKKDEAEEEKKSEEAEGIYSVIQTKWTCQRNVRKLCIVCSSVTKACYARLYQTLIIICSLKAVDSSLCFFFIVLLLLLLLFIFFMKWERFLVPFTLQHRICISYCWIFASFFLLLYSLSPSPRTVWLFYYDALGRFHFRFDGAHELRKTACKRIK